MTVTGETKELVRQRANSSCEFCGVTEIDAGGALTIDHYQPKAKGGADTPDNLLYCCARCNQYKADYWPAHPEDPLLWHPRLEPAAIHFFDLDDGMLQPLTATGAFTLIRLRLNRPPLVAYRLRKQQQADETLLLTRYRELVESLGQLNGQLTELMQEQHQLLQEQRELYRLLLRGRR